ncbi:hypothetical protein DPMN_100507 [Dreissena polymorpha]|uniref:Uncharacterized protein n=1 Tax=Dreissena polymorpha TaxID=45954 RepID=A0A9D4LJD5_DREPO|nr:hypothetical protein DPMN_100507 [Dreissena polymorpha]
MLDVQALETQEKELSIMALLKVPDTERNSKGEKRQRIRPTFRMNGMVVCRQTFLLVYCLSVDKLKALQKHVREKGVVPRVHGNTGRKPAHAISYDDVLRVVRFIQNTSNERGILQPAAPRGIDNFPPVYLSAETTELALNEELYFNSNRYCSYHYRKGKCTMNACVRVRKKILSTSTLTSVKV